MGSLWSAAAALDRHLSSKTKTVVAAGSVESTFELPVVF
jgi:hypothetical protein